MAHFPVFVDLSTKKCMIFGGGKVALRKIQTLSRYEADMEIISERFDPEIRKLLPDEKLHDGSEQSLTEWLEKADLVIAATSDRETNRYISSWCAAHGVLVNVVDAAEECTFLFPSVVKRGDISIGINSAGQSPVVSKKIRQEIEQAIPEYYGEIAAQLGEIRSLVKEKIETQEERQTILRKLAQEAFIKERPLNEEELAELGI